MKYKNIIIFAVALLFLAAAVFFVTDDIMTPYVSFKEAKGKSGKFVQVIGKLKKSVPVEHNEGEFTFALKDKDNTYMNILHKGNKPMNFEHAEQIVLLGKYDSKIEIFNADKILVKCPSKYRRKK